VEWRSYEQGEEPGTFFPEVGPVPSGWPTALYRTSFDTPGTNVVEAAVLDDDGNVQSSVQWTVTVTEDAPEPPTREPITPDGDTLYFEETGTWTAGIDGGDGPFRVGWWLAICDVVQTTDTTSGTTTVDVPNNRAEECEPWPVAIDENGMSTGVSDPGWDVTYQKPLAVEIVDTGTDGQVVAEVSNVGTESHDFDVELELEEDGSFTTADATSLTLESGETREVTLEYEDDREEFDVRVTGRTGLRTDVRDTATVTQDQAGPSDDGGGNNDTDGQNSLPAFSVAWAAGSMVGIAGLVARRE
jgi:hypothetical protein